MSNTTHLSNLAKYYRDLLFELSTQAGKHFVDLKKVLSYRLTADLGLFIPNLEELITSETISFTIEKASPLVVDKIIEKATEIEDKEEQGELFEEVEIGPEEQERKDASATLVGIYRKQQFDPYNRETIVGFSIIAGKIGNNKICAPLFYYKVHIDFDPLKSLITLIKEFEIPALNFQLIKQFVESDEDIEMIRQQILPYRYREDFGLSTVREIIQKLSELVEGFRGITYSSKPSSLRKAIELRDKNGFSLLNTSIIVNARRTHAHLLDDLTHLAQIEEIGDETVVKTILSEPVEREDLEDIDDPDTRKSQSLLLFPRLNNKAQRVAAVKAEKAKLLVIQGPPGTGKSQTIANLICHLVAQGKTVLMTSHQNKALEVVTKILPTINYLAMSLLKGERESLNELRNKIEGFSSYVSGVDIIRYKRLLEDQWADLRKVNDDIKRLEVRFSELKILEREQCPTYHKYHKIRDYDIIASNESIPAGIDSHVATALTEYSTLLQKLKDYYLDIENIFFLSGDNPTLLKIKAEHFSVFLKYCDIRDYDVIDPSDSIPEGMDYQVGHALLEYSTLLQKLKDSYSDIVKILPCYDPTLTDEDYLNSIEVAIEHIKQLIYAFEWIKKNLFTNKDILDFCQQFSQLNKPLDSTESINYLDALIQWVAKYCNELITSKKLLSELYNLEIDFQTIKKQIAEYGTENILRCVENLIQKFQTMQGAIPEDGFPEYPDNLFLEETNIHLEILSASSNSWLRWHLSPSARNSRRFLTSTKFPRVMYKRRTEFLDKVKAWHSHWTLRNQIMKDFKYLSELNIPIKNLSQKPTLAELLKSANLTHKYSQVMVAVDSFPAIYSDKIKNFLEQKVLNISTFEDISIFKECLGKAKAYLEINENLNKLKVNNNLLSPLFSSFEKTICELCSDEEADKHFNKLSGLHPYFYEYKKLKSLEHTVLKNLPQTCDKLRNGILKQNTIKAVEPEFVIEAFKLAKYVGENLSVNPSVLDEGKIRKLQPYFDDYIRIKALEGSDLKTLPKTCSKIKDEILKGNSIPALKSPDLIVEAFRLSAFMRDDLLKNPDDINEVGAKIKRLKEESREKILKILNTSRKLALREADRSNVTRYMINSLNQILRRKRKTYSFVQLRDKINYKRLLSVFPCWIMSIEDVSRIFPLEAGLFDYLIIDEASQCNQATTLHLAYRAKRMIVVGDDKQMKNPNTRFLGDSVVRLNLTKHNLDKHPKAEFLHGRNSLLDLAIGCQDISPVFLNEHFRCEPPIIDFPNKRFYNEQLKILTPFRRKRFNPCMEIRTINGAYDDPDDTKQNIVEAQAVIAELKRMIESGEFEGDRKGEKLSVGILSPFRRQATLLQSMMYEAFENTPHIIKEHDIIVSTVDGFQGDERDVILYSFRYAPNSKPGTIHAIQREDEHSLGRLNVAFSRARRRVICFISVSKNNFPKGLIRDYLTHVASIQNSSYSRLGNPNEREKCQSDFEMDVFDELVKNGLEVYAQVPCAGFFIDFVVIDKEGRRIAVECDGEFHYDEYGELREEDYQRQDIIERNGWFVHRISSRKFYANPQRAIDKLIEDLQKQEPDKEISVAEVTPETFDESSQTTTQEIVKEAEHFSETVSHSIPQNIEDKIIAFLSEEGPMPLWKIAQKTGLPKEETLIILENLLKQEWVINYYENGVKLWKAID